MSARCASLNDALRTARACGLSHETVNDMQRNDSRECAEDEREAHIKMSQDRSASARERQSAQQADKAAREQAALREQQCGESKRILVAKRARTDLNEGEKAELARFEDKDRKRCG